MLNEVVGKDFLKYHERDLVLHMIVIYNENNNNNKYLIHTGFVSVFFGSCSSSVYLLIRKDMR